MTPYRICASVPPERPDPDVVRYAARVRDERRRSALVAGLLLAVSALVALLAMAFLPEPPCARIVVDEGRAPVPDLPMPMPTPSVWDLHPARAAFVRSVAQDIAALEPRYPELADFDVGRDLHGDGLGISYLFLHASSPIAGRKKYAHDPEPEGLYLHVRLVEESSGCRVDAQVSGYPRKLRAGERSFVPPSEGPGGPTVYRAIGEILERHERGVRWIRS
jgi:hypothetical protein